MKIETRPILTMANSKIKSVFSKFGPLLVRKEIKITLLVQKKVLQITAILYNLTLGNTNMKFIYLNFGSSGGQKGIEVLGSKIVKN